MSTTQVTGLSLSDTPVLEYVLADIPFFCVGLTALAVFAFFIVMRRINPPAIYLYTSSLFAFGGSILDLTQILVRGSSNTNNGLGLNSVMGIIDAREVTFALAFGFRYLYLWAFVAQRPRYEPRPSSRIDPLYPEVNLHSASWERWGLPGFMLKYTLLGAIISIPILQIIWRIATGNSPVYIAESTVQIAVSVLLIAKLLLNLFLSTVAPWWRPFLPYIVPIFALMISTGLGAGNVLFFKFSETTLGRFLQAVETYSLITSVLIFTFYKVPRYVPPEPVKVRKRSSFFTGVPSRSEELIVEVSAPNVIGSTLPTISSDRRASRGSPVSRISSWLNPRRPARPTSTEKKLWDAGDAELGLSAPADSPTPEPQDDNEVILSPRVQLFEERQRPPLVVKTTQPEVVVPPTPNTLEAATPSTATRPFTGVSFASYYGMASANRLTMPAVTPGDESRSTDSPVYGLNGIISSDPAAPESPILDRRPPSPAPPVGNAPPSPLLAPAVLQQRESTNSFDELLRQQTELDKSIAALRLFSSEPAPAGRLSDTERKSAIRSISVSSGKSNRSEFSLSIFPDPPLVDRTSMLPESLVAGRAGNNDVRLPAGRGRRQSQVPLSAVSPLADIDEGLSAPSSPAHMRFESAGTQYDVTSFIGNLTTPGPSRSELAASFLGDVEEKPESISDMESPVITTATPALRPLLLSTTSPAITSLSPSSSGPNSSSSPTTSPSSQMSPNYEYPVLKPLLLGSTTPTVPSPLSAGARRTPGARRPSMRRGERPVISVPRKLDGEQAEEPEAFEKPRRPPVVSDS